MAEHKTAKRPSRAENAAYVIEMMRTLGETPAPDSRLMRMHDIFQRGHIPFHDPEFPVALQADRDLTEVGFILDQLNVHRSDRKFRQLVKDLLRDSCLPQADRENSAGRDGQFELYLAAICQKGGMTPVGYVEPDVTCTVDGIEVGIAAKRIKSLRNARRRIMEATDQIKRAARPGIIALEMSVAWNKRNAPITSLLHSQVYNAIFDQLAYRFLKRHGDAVAKANNDNKVLAMVVFAFTAHAKGQKWEHRRCAFWRPFDVGAASTELFERFYERFNAVTSTTIETASIAE